MDRKMKILAVGAHPDDVELYMMGTLLKYIEQGHEVIVIIATDGDFELGNSNKELSKKRLKEAIASFLKVNIKPMFLHYQDG